MQQRGVTGRVQVYALHKLLSLAHTYSSFLGITAWGWLLEESLKGNLLLSLNVLEKVPHNLLSPALLPFPGGQPPIPTCLLPKDTSNDSFFTVKKRDTQNIAAEVVFTEGKGFKQ